MRRGGTLERARLAADLYVASIDTAPLTVQQAAKAAGCSPSAVKDVLDAAGAPRQVPRKCVSGRDRWRALVRRAAAADLVTLFPHMTPRAAAARFGLEHL